MQSVAGDLQSLEVLLVLLILDFLWKWQWAMPIEAGENVTGQN